MAYAENTKVSVDKSRGEIEKMLQKRGAASFFAGFRDEKIFVLFELKNLKVRIEIPLPKNASDRQTQQKWRAMFLTIKSRLVSIDEKVETFEQAFLSHIITNDGQTVGEILIPQLPASIRNSEIKLLNG